MKRILGLLMAFMLCLGVFTLVGGVNTVKAAEGDIASGTSGTCTWVIDKNGILTISAADGDVGYIESDDFTLTSWPWYSYNSYVKKVIIEDRIVLGKSMYGMFCSMKSCTSIDGLSNLDTSNVVDMSAAFSQDSKLVSLDLTGWNTDKVTKISSMFNGCTNLKTLELGNFNALNLIYGYGTFFNCHALEKLDLSNFDISKCYDKNMFANIYNLHTVVLS